MDNEITIEPISSITTSLWTFRVLTAAVKLNVFNVVEQIQDVKKISDELKLELDPLERLLNTLVAMELLEKKANLYFNKPISSKFLVKSSNAYYGDFILMNEESDNSTKALDEVIKTGLPDTGDNRKELARVGFTRAMHNNAQAPARVLSKLIDFNDKNHLLDIGGGSGAFSIILTNKFENLKATVIEQPAVCITTLEYVKREGNLDKIETLEGDYFKVEFPSHDIALFGQILHSNSVEQNNLLLKKVYEKLEENGLVIITEFLLNEDKTGPLFPTLFSLNMLKQTKGGRSYTFSEIKTWLENIGFKNIEKQHLVGPHTVIIAHK